MALRMASIIGEALHFGARRIETIARVAWLPVLLLLLVNVATVFVGLSIIAERPVAFRDVTTFVNAEALLGQYAMRGWTLHPEKMALVAAVSFAFQTILVASFMAPLIRLSGLGEAPARRSASLPFGADQVRFVAASLFSALFLFLLVLAPIGVTSFFVIKYVSAALSQTFASFPDPESLHTVEFITMGQRIAEGGGGAFAGLHAPIAVAAPIALLVWAIVFLHFHPRNRPAATRDDAPILRAGATLLGVAGLIAGGFYLLRAQAVNGLTMAAQFGGEAAPSFSGQAVNAVLIFVVLGYLLFGYFNLRLYAYPGVAVCRRSLAPGGLLSVTRGWNLVRLQIILVLIGLVLAVAQYFINGLGLVWIGQTLDTLYQATDVSTRLVNSGESAGWVRPVFVWVWNTLKVSVNIAWMFFTYGVAAALYGRLYRESET